MDESEETRIHIDGLSLAEVALLRQVSTEAADKAVAKGMLVLGFDIRDPLAAQDQMAMLRRQVVRMDDEEVQLDRDWVRRTRVRSEGVMGKIMFTAIGIAVMGAAHAMWTGAISIMKMKAG